MTCFDCWIQTLSVYLTCIQTPSHSSHVYSNPISLLTRVFKPHLTPHTCIQTPSHSSHVYSKPISLNAGNPTGGVIPGETNPNPNPNPNPTQAIPLVGSFLERLSNASQELTHITFDCTVFSTAPMLRRHVLLASAYLPLNCSQV